MKVSFSKSVPFVPEFNGNRNLPDAEQIKTTLTPLKMGEVIDIGEVLKTLGFEGATEHTALSFEQMRILATQAGKYVLNNVTLSGLDGFTVDDVVNYAPFFGLATELLFQLTSISNPNVTDVKN